jgi:hypothetical protein
VDYLLAKTTQLIEKMFVYPERMLENLNLMKGLVFSGQLLLDLTKKGVTREEPIGGYNEMPCGFGPMKGISVVCAGR